MSVLPSTFTLPKPPLKRRLFAVDYSVVDYSLATELIISHGQARHSYAMSALAVHGLIEAVWDPSLARAISKIDLVAPDGQPVRWALNSLYKVGLKDRVCGPDLTLLVLQRAHELKLNLYLYGSTEQTLLLYQKFIEEKYSGIKVVGVHADRFRDATAKEDQEDVDKINQSGAHIVLVGRGCPRQERWVSDHKGHVHAAMMAVGAAFDFHAGTLKRCPVWMQNAGLEWLYRLGREPRRLMKRYVSTNSYFIYLFFKQKLTHSNS